VLLAPKSIASLPDIARPRFFYSRLANQIASIPQADETDDARLSRRHRGAAAQELVTIRIETHRLAHVAFSGDSLAQEVGYIVVDGSHHVYFGN
jgi:hypothetical protein